MESPRPKNVPRFPAAGRAVTFTHVSNENARVACDVQGHPPVARGIVTRLAPLKSVDDTPPAAATTRVGSPPNTEVPTIVPLNGVFPLKSFPFASSL